MKKIFLLVLAIFFSCTQSTLVGELSNFKKIDLGFSQFTEFKSEIDVTLKNANSKLEESATIVIDLYKDNQFYINKLKTVLVESKKINIEIGKLDEGEYNLKATLQLPNNTEEMNSDIFKVEKNGKPAPSFEIPETGIYTGNTIEVNPAESLYSNNIDDNNIEFVSAIFSLKKRVNENDEWVLVEDPTLTGLSLTKENYNKAFNWTLPTIEGKYKLTLTIKSKNNDEEMETSFSKDLNVDFYNQVKSIVVNGNSKTGQFSTEKFNITYTGNIDDKDVSTKGFNITVTPSDNDIVSQDLNSFHIKFEKTGTYTITVTSKDNSSATENISVEVIESKASSTKVIEGNTLKLIHSENFNDMPTVLNNFSTKGTNDDESAKVWKRVYWRPEALAVNNNCLELHTKEYATNPDGTQYTYFGKDGLNHNWITGGIHLKKKHCFGYIEARIKMKKDSTAHWDAFWLYNSDGDGKTSPILYEYDIMEYTKKGTIIDNTTHWWGKTAKHFQTRTYQSQSINADNFNDWVTMGVYWSPEKVQYYYNEKLANGWTKEGKGIGKYSDMALASGKKSEIPCISKWLQQAKFTTELGQNYGGGVPASGTDDIFYVDYLATYELVVTEAEIKPAENGTITFNYIDNNLVRHPDNIASQGNKIYVNVTPNTGYKVKSVTADSQLMEKDEKGYFYLVTETSPKYWDFNTQKFGPTLKITAEFEEVN